MMVRTLITIAFLLLCSGNNAVGQEESTRQYDSLQMIASEISQSYTQSDININLAKPPMAFDYASTMELIETYGTYPEPELPLQEFNGDPNDLEGVTSRDVYLLGQPVTIFLADDDTFLNIKLVNGGHQKGQR